MISKNDFLEFVSRVERTEKGISKIEDAFEGTCLREHDFVLYPIMRDELLILC